MPTRNKTATKTVLHILIVDDDSVLREPIADFLSVRGHSVVQKKSGTEALEYLSKNKVDIIITDIKMPGADGFEILMYAKRYIPQSEVIMMTGFGDIDIAVKAMRDGAFDFFTKPLKMQELTASIERTERFHALRKERDQAQLRLQKINKEARLKYGLTSFIGLSPPIQKVKELVEQVAQTDATTVLIVGETGTGKEVVARAIHHESPRSSGPIVAVDCTAIPDNLFENAFYGHEKGAFTDAKEAYHGYFEQADGGTLFLDEIGDMPTDMQVRLLRTLEERAIRRLGSNSEIPVNVRVVSATNQNLTDAIVNRRFREDLYHRLNTFIIQLPPLRERSEDLESLAYHFLARYSREMGAQIRSFTPEAIERLKSYTFPGNVRELKNTIERAVILCQTNQIKIEDLQFTITNDQPLTDLSQQNVVFNFSSTLQNLTDDHLSLANIEADVIREALRRCKDNKSLAAELLGLSRFALRRRMDIYGIK